MSCAIAGVIAFDVDDAYAYDVDEPVDVTLTYAPEFTTAPFAIGWDKNGSDGHGASTDIQPDAGAPLRHVTLRLDRARLAGQGILTADLAVGARNQGAIALCDIELARSNTTKTSATIGRLQLDITDSVSGRATAARIGLYDVTGRTPLPADGALSVHRLAGDARLQWLTVREPPGVLRARQLPRGRAGGHLRSRRNART